MDALHQRETANRLAAALDRLVAALALLEDHPARADVAQAALLVSGARELCARQEELWAEAA